MTEHIKLVIKLDHAYQEVFIAALEEVDYEGFQQEEDELTAYFLKERFGLHDREHINRLLAAYPGNNYVLSEEIVADQNWNQQWEQTIQPQTIGHFLVKPTWSRVEAKPHQIKLEIDPKMAFGTGYHSTTRLMLEQLPDVVTKGCSVLDAGTGSGILSIAAAKLGAEKVTAFDNDEWCVTSARENKYLNDVSDKIKILKGDHQIIDEQWKFDVILANITRSIIEKMLPTLVNHLKGKSTILLSGLLKNDIDKLRNLLMNNNIININIRGEDEWVVIKGQK
jgi:ribosomal protein L11 methyltransferase